MPFVAKFKKQQADLLYIVAHVPFIPLHGLKLWVTDSLMLTQIFISKCNRITFQANEQKKNYFPEKQNTQE